MLEEEGCYFIGNERRVVYDIEEVTGDRIYRMARSKAFLFKGIKINWSCAPELIASGESTPQKAE